MPHTPTPWKWGAHPRRPFRHVLFGRDGEVAVAATGTMTSEDRHLIVRGVNSHAALVAALEMVQSRWTFDNHQQHTHTWHDAQDCLNVIRAAMTLARKEM